MSEKYLTPEQIETATKTLVNGVENVDAIMTYVVGTDAASGSNCIGGGVAGRFSLNQLQGLHLSFMRTVVKALVQMTGLSPHDAELMLAMATVEGAQGHMYSGEEGQQDNSMELAQAMGVSQESEEATADIMKRIMGGDTDSRLN